MVSLPFDILLFDILMRLNANSIDRCKCVCREWRHRLSSWEFVWLYLNYAESYLLIYYCCVLVRLNLKNFLSTLFLLIRIYLPFMNAGNSMGG
ncbi:putative F-box-like domain superfamily protein [Helianthus anomalus]